MEEENRKCVNGTGNHIGNSLDNDDRKDTILVCPSHKSQALEYYCAACETAVCVTCTVMEHSAHNTMPSSEALAEHKDSLKKMLESAQGQIPNIQDSISIVKEVSNTLMENYKNAEAKIQDSFHELEKLLMQRKDSMMSDLECTFNEKQDTLSTQLQTLEALLDSINKCCEFTENALTHGNDTEVGHCILLFFQKQSFKLSFIDKLIDFLGYYPLEVVEIYFVFGKNKTLHIVCNLTYYLD